ncbi:hypothetical protein B0H15DRAFT_848396 [Mycena belliarum]|uniref:Uncharacterized protein n=1 Tax=Mycena belliarum TaxID=1033014 RepID=A0AAD6TZL7_9AGAR|nr:hypothetical protein B0H15DRAFT_848396 [Mycena belliae]
MPVRFFPCLSFSPRQTSYASIMHVVNRPPFHLSLVVLFHSPVLCRAAASSAKFHFPSPSLHIPPHLHPYIFLPSFIPTARPPPRLPSARPIPRLLVSRALPNPEVPPPFRVCPPCRSYTPLPRPPLHLPCSPSVLSSFLFSSSSRPHPHPRSFVSQSSHHIMC